MSHLIPAELQEAVEAAPDKVVERVRDGNRITQIIVTSASLGKRIIVDIDPNTSGMISPATIENI